MAVAYQAVGTAVDSVLTTLTLVAPASQADDIFVINMMTADNNVAIFPVDWNVIGVINNGAGMRQSAAWYRASDSDSGATFVVTVAGTTDAYGVISSYRGTAVVGSPLGNQVAVLANASSATITTGTINPYNGTSLIVVLAGYLLDGATATTFSGTNPTLATNYADSDTTSTTASIYGTSGLSNTGAAVGARTMASGLTAAINTTIMFELLAPPGEGIGYGGGYGRNFTGPLYRTRGGDLSRTPG